MKKRYCAIAWVSFILLFIAILWGMSLPTEAALADSPYVTFSPGGDAFTINAGDANTEWYDDGITIHTGITSTLREPGVGEHIYSPERIENIPVGRWEVVHERGKCIHDAYPAGNYYYGVEFGRKKCFKEYYSGWFAYCADCNEVIVNMLFYMSRDAAKTISHLDMLKAYYYKCPHCDNLEMAHELPVHNCKDISANRYYIRYNANYGSGYMEKSTHMYNNSTVYEGREVTPQTTLNLNTYTRTGYQFTGWNTKKDGSGKAYADGAAVYNLTDEENGTVILYAQWERCQSVLQIDPAGGTYEGKEGISSIAGQYGSQYIINIANLKAPAGYTVQFDTKGGTPVGDITGTRSFVEWSCRQPFHGKLIGNEYSFWGNDGDIDYITALYTEDAIILPDTSKPGHSFGGWYFDEECTKPAGNPGSSYVPSKNITLYACWVDLKLTAEDNYTANLGKGAVNLEWSQNDNKNKIYQLYQKTDTTDWVQISSAEEKADSYHVSDTIAYTGKPGSITIPYTGFYRVSLYGAQGGNYSGYSGGKGGMVEAVIYFEKGERLSYEIGGQNGYAGGGSADSFGNGGGYSRLYSSQRGTILIAGGGGGASSMENGGLGGSAAHVISSQNGENGASGGGGGYQGGAAGVVQVHNHTAACRHVHVGNSSSYGGCYTQPVQCGGRSFEKKESKRTFYYGNRNEEGEWVYCVRCGSYECPGHLDIVYRYVCNACETSYERNAPVRCTAMKGYALACGREESYICGMSAGQVINARPAYGGSNYIDSVQCTSFTEEAGVQSGNGKLVIASEQIGVLSENYLNGVVATDLAAPDGINVSTVIKTAVSEKEIRISFKKPADNGTNYYHKVESYAKDTNTLLCTSNQTLNTLISGITGYKYVIDSSKNTEVKAEDDYFAEKGETPFLVVEVGAGTKYLHVAAVDKAGNIGPTTHILVSDQDVIYWPLRTEKIQISPDTNVYPADETDTYYVKADAATPFRVSFEGLLCGTARNDYQIGHLSFLTKNLSGGSDEGKFTIITPNRSSVTAGTFTYQMKQLQKLHEGILSVQDASYTVTKRYNQCKSIDMNQEFTMAESYDGKKIRLSPQAGAEGKEGMVYSEQSSDLSNSIYLIADASAPIVQGMELLQDMDYADYSDGSSLEVNLTAKDTGSGLAQFYVEVHNMENGSIVKYEDEEQDGKIRFHISDEETVFCGEFVVIIYAKDNVGNETSESTKLLGVGLDAYVERVLEPHDAAFKRGESGILHIKTVGYVEKVEVMFPDDFVGENGSYNRTYLYEVPEYLQTEEVDFIVPFTVPDGEVTILVKAYKAGTELEATPRLVTINIKGSILDELRTRLR